MDIDLLQFITRNFSFINIKPIDKILSLKIIKIKDIAINLTISIKTVKEFWLKLFTQYHEKSWKTEFILFQKLIYLKYLDYENIENYIDKFYEISQRLANLG